MLDAKSTHYSFFNIGLGVNGTDGAYVFGWYNANWRDFLLLTADSSYPYKTSYIRKFAHNGFYWITDNASSSYAGVGYASTISIGGQQTIYKDANMDFMASNNSISTFGDGGLFGYGIPTTKIYSDIYDYSFVDKRVFWCEDNWKLRASPSSSCQLSSDNKIASCPTTIGNQFLCVP